MMFLINWWAALLTLVIVALLYKYVDFTKPKVSSIVTGGKRVETLYKYRSDRIWLQDIFTASLALKVKKKIA